ncbi:MAG: phosphoglucosamine mutase [Candidatus Bathyarchaeota archaeon]|nr:phosphoglucosamine mutase [Candidatus Bathyarchaeota archaeon]
MGKLFGSSGVRGLVNVVLTPQLACKVGMAVATQAKAQRAVVGRDTRASGPMLEDALVAGLTSAGVDVSFVGEVPTPAVAYLTKTLGVDVGFMLTASHNPPQYNGIKVFRGDSLSFTDAEQNAVEEIVAESKYALADWQNVGKATPIDAASRYVDMLIKAAKLQKPWRVVVDPGCGATYQTAPAALNALGCKVTALNAQPDGYFPARKSEPTAQSLTSLAKTVQALGAEVGLAFDGDGDRVAFVDETGAFVDFDRALAAFSAYALKKCGGNGTIVTNVEASMCVETMAQRWNGKVIRTRVGDVYVSEAMAEANAVFGGEPCGAWVHPQIHWCPDGPLSAVLMLKALEEEEMSLREFIAQVPEYVTLRENLTCKNEQKFQIIAAIEQTITQAFPEYTDLSTVDGVRLALEDGWLLIRASGTEPLIRLTAEGESLKAAQQIKDRGVTLVKTHSGGA